MKTVLIEMLAFALLCVFGTAAGGFLIMLYHGVASFVAGSQMNTLSAEAFLSGMIAAFPVLLLFVPMFLLLTLIRHPRYNKILGSATIAVLSMSAWFFLAPISFKISQERNFFAAQSSNDLTPGYFRNINGSLYYFTFASGNYVSGIRVKNDYFSSDKTDNAIRILDSGYLNFKRDAYGFSDPIVGENLTPPPVLQNFLKGIATITVHAAKASSQGIVKWLIFSSIMAALVSVGAVISASEWKLADAFYITFDTFVILTLNCFYLLGRFDTFVQALENFGSLGLLAKNNFQLAINCAAMLFLILLGTVKAVVHARKRMESEQ